jgi:hypothetical protein|tara:strand:- start:99 stop:242 length:144 start_codon:yes stop_codon:yes gene_type:complete
MPLKNNRLHRLIMRAVKPQAKAAATADETPTRQAMLPNGISFVKAHE